MGREDFQHLSSIGQIGQRNVGARIQEILAGMAPGCHGDGENTERLSTGHVVGCVADDDNLWSHEGATGIRVGPLDRDRGQS